MGWMGREWLEQALKERGNGKQLAHSRTADCILDALLSEDVMVHAFDEAYDGEGKKILFKKCADILKSEDEIFLREKEVAKKEELYKDIEKCETAEARDKIRLAEYYKKSISENKGDYDYPKRMMAGLSNILGATRVEKQKIEE